jgi:hypothetical protein
LVWSQSEAGEFDSPAFGDHVNATEGNDLSQDFCRMWKRLLKRAAAVWVDVLEIGAGCTFDCVAALQSKYWGRDIGLRRNSAKMPCRAPFRGLQCNESVLPVSGSGRVRISYTTQLQRAQSRMLGLTGASG